MLGDVSKQTFYVTHGLCKVGDIFSQATPLSHFLSHTHVYSLSLSLIQLSICLFLISLSHTPSMKHNISFSFVV